MADELFVPMQLTLHSSGVDPTAETGRVENADPRLKAAILKMRKLDRILEKKFAEEKEVICNIY